MAGWMGKGGRLGTSVAGVVLIAVILFLVNVILSGSLLRLDLTQGKEFTISKATREILGNLRDLTTITVYMSKDMPPQLSTLRRQVSDALEEYRSYGKGHIQIEFVDPGTDAETQRRLQGIGIPQIMAQTVQSDQLQVVNIYLGMTVAYLDRQEVLPVIENTENLEYDLTSAILKVSREKAYTIGVLTGPTEYDTTKNLTSLNELLQKQFSVRSVNIGAGDEAIPTDIDLLLVAGPAEVPDRVKYQIDQFVMRGGRTLFLVDPIRLPEGGGLQAYPLDAGIEDLLANYGVRVQKALVVDRALCESASFSGGYVRYTLPYPFWPKTVPELLNQSLPVTAKLESLVFPWAAPLELDVPVAAGDPLGKIKELEASDRKARAEMAAKLGMETPPEGESGTPAPNTDTAGAPVVADVLVRTSPGAWAVSGRYDLNPQQPFVPGKTAAQVLAVALTGRFKSFYSDHPVPPVSVPPAGEGATPPAGTPALDAPVLESPPDTRILVVGNAQFATDSFMGQFPANSLFVLNAVDWMTLGDQLISIRSRGATDRPLATLSDGAKSRVKLICILGTPLLVIIGGIARFSMRRRVWSAQEVAAREA
jgi:ABC-2 type transport system permease protein